MDPISIAMGLAQFAPTVVKWLTGSDKAEQAAGAVVDIARQVTGRSDGNDALNAIAADPALAVQFRMAVMANEADLDKAYLADRQDARRRDVALVQAGSTNLRANWMVFMAAVGTIAGFVGMCVLGYLKAKYPDALNDGVFGALLAQLSTITAYFGLCLRDAFQFEFGSSRGSKDSGEALRQIATSKNS